MTDHATTASMRVFYHTFGCKANQYDTERMRQEIEARGGETTVECSAADVYVVNTCTVTNQADADARRFIRRLVRENSEAQIVVAGCSAALKADEYRAMPRVTAVILSPLPEHLSRPHRSRLSSDRR
jgi:threonylcarbamoyladenosine tRNA methylthiotransferase MtaB